MADMSKTWASMTEVQLQTSALEAMGWSGWTTYHTHDSRRSNPGFPDVVAFKGSRLMFVEFKRESGVVRPEQHAWLEGLTAAHDEVYLVRPSNFDAFLEVIVTTGNTTCHWRNRND